MQIQVISLHYTIGYYECYDHPLPGQEARLISSYAPKPVKYCSPKEPPVEDVPQEAVFHQHEIDIYKDTIIEPYHKHAPVQISPL